MCFPELEDHEDWEEEEQEEGWLVVGGHIGTALIAVDRSPDCRGCMVVDIVCSCNVSSLTEDRISEEDDVWHEMKPFHKIFGLADGQNYQCTLQVTQGFQYGLPCDRTSRV